MNPERTILKNLLDLFDVISGPTDRFHQVKYLDVGNFGGKSTTGIRKTVSEQPLPYGSILTSPTVTNVMTIPNTDRPRYGLGWQVLTQSDLCNKVEHS